MSDPGSNAHQSQGRYQSGVWLSRAEGVRSEKYQRWTDEHTKCKMQTLDKQKHSSLVKLNSQQLEVRTELRGLQQHRRQLNRDRQGSGEGGSDPLHRDSSKSLPRPASVSSDASRRRIQKGSSTGSLASAGSTGHSSSPSSSSSSASAFKRSSSVGKDGLLGSKTAAGMKVKGVEAKLLDPEVSATKLRNFHSSRALSKLKNNMDINN